MVDLCIICMITVITLIFLSSVFHSKAVTCPQKCFYLLSGLKLFVSAKLLQFFLILSDVAVHFTNACWIREQMASNIFSKSFTIGTIHIFLNLIWITTKLYLNWNINNEARHVLYKILFYFVYKINKKR